MQSKSTRQKSWLKTFLMAIEVMMLNKKFIVIGYHVEKDCLKYKSVAFGLVKEDIVVYTDIYLSNLEQVIDDEDLQDAAIEETLNIINGKNST